MTVPKTISMMYQRVESRIMIQHLSKELTTSMKHPFYTVHDSVGYHPEDKDIFNRIYLEVFDKFNIIPLKLK